MRLILCSLQLQQEDTEYKAQSKAKRQEVMVKCKHSYYFTVCYTTVA
jgi:hypothetical protein